MDFSQNNYTYVWENSLKKSFDFGRARYDLGIMTNSTFLMRPSEYWQESVDASLAAEFELAKGISIAPTIKHSRNALQDRVLYASEIKLALPFRRLGPVEFAPFMANRAIKRVGTELRGVDRGAGYGFVTSLKPSKFLGNAIESEVSYESYDLNRIPFSEFRANVAGLMTLGQADTIRWKIHDLVSATRYFAASVHDDTRGDIMQQNKNDLGAETGVRLTLPGEVTSMISAGAGSVDYDYEMVTRVGPAPERDNYKKQANYRLDFSRIFFERILASAGYRYDWGKEDYSSRILDQWLELGEFSFKVQAAIGRFDSLALGGIFGVTSYYSLDNSPIRERDLRTQIYNLRFGHVFSQYFAGELAAGYSSFYQVYTSGLYSADNNQNETYTLRTTFNWNLTSRCAIKQGFEIRANYIIFDYVPNPIETPSRIFRRGLSETGLRLQVSERLTLMPVYTYRYEDYGKLIWEEGNWQQATGWDRRFHSITAKASYLPFRKVSFEPEITWEAKKEYDHKLIRSDGPFGDGRVVREQRLDDMKQIAAVKLTWQFSDTEYLAASYSRRRWEIGHEVYDVSDFISVSVRYLF